MPKAIPLFVTACAVAPGLLFCTQGQETKHSYIPKEGFVPDRETSVRIAEAVLTPIYGTSAVEKQKPFNAVLTNDAWIVTGTLRKGEVGGVATVEISRSDGCIRRVSHGK